MLQFLKVGLTVDSKYLYFCYKLMYIYKAVVSIFNYHPQSTRENRSAEWVRSWVGNPGLK